MGQTLSNFNEVIGERRAARLVTINDSKTNDITSDYWKRSSAALATWQTNADRPMRITMIHRLLELLDMKLGRRIPRQQLADIARLLELALYRRANSQQEYVCYKTLEKRLEYLALIGYPPSTHNHNHNSKKRKLLENEIESFLYTLPKKVKFSVKVIRPPYSYRKIRHSTNSGFILQENDDLIRHVFSFLDGKNVLALTSLNSYCKQNIPKFITSLHMTPNDLSLASFNGSNFTKCFNLKALVISHHKPLLRHNNWSVPQYSAKASHQCYCCNHDNAEGIIYKLASLLENFKNLRVLSLQSVFFTSLGINAISALCTALENKACPVLETLELPGNGIGDMGADYIGRMLNVLSKLKVLDLRKNYIGEKGMTSLCNAIKSESCVALEVLALGGNILTESSIEALTSSVDKLPSLEFLGLDKNFNGDVVTSKLLEYVLENEGVCPALKQLLLNNSDFYDESVNVLVEYLSKKKTSMLQLVDLGRVTFDGALSLLFSKNIKRPVVRYYFDQEEQEQEEMEAQDYGI